MRRLVLATAIAALSGCSSLPEPGPYWHRDSQYGPAKIVEVDVTPYVAAWCKRVAWGCAMRLERRYDYDLTVIPAKCVIVVDSRLSQVDQARVIEHERCHCRGYDHSNHMVHGRFDPCPTAD